MPQPGPESLRLVTVRKTAWTAREVLITHAFATLGLGAFLDAIQRWGDQQDTDMSGSSGGN